VLFPWGVPFRDNNSEDGMLVVFQSTRPVYGLGSSPLAEPRAHYKKSFTGMKGDVSSSFCCAARVSGQEGLSARKGAPEPYTRVPSRNVSLESWVK